MLYRPPNPNVPGCTVVALPGGLYTYREVRRDVDRCSYCKSRKKRVYYDYENLDGRPAFCNMQCWFGYVLRDHLRRKPSPQYRAPQSKGKANPKHADPKKPKRRPATERPKEPARRRRRQPVVGAAVTS